MNSLQRCKPLLGTYVEISLSAELSDAELIALSNLAFSVVASVHESMSFHDRQSELSSINRRAYSETVSLSEQMFEVFTFTQELHRVSQGLFDPCVASELVNTQFLPLPSTRNFELSHYSGRWQDVELSNNSVRFNKPLLIDLGGIAKGYAVDRAIECLPYSVNAIVNAGGDLRMSHWQGQEVELVYQQGDKLMTHSSLMQSCSVATSASYYHAHKSVIINPLSRQSILSGQSYSVFANTCMTADALTKLAWLGDQTDIINLDSILKHFDASFSITS
jgi:thiamine biosynthesis lipoprotein